MSRCVLILVSVICGLLAALAARAVNTVLDFLMVASTLIAALWLIDVLSDKGYEG